MYKEKTKMAKIFYPDFFNDVFGPIMQPGSSGGFAGPARIGNVAASLIGGKVKKVRFLFNPSEKEQFRTLGNFMTDRGYLGGVLGFKPDDVRLFEAHKLAKKAKVSYEFKLNHTENGHHRALTIEVRDEQGQSGYLVGASVGGGMIRIYEVNGLRLNWQADTYGLLVESGPKEQIGKGQEELEANLADYIVEVYHVKGNGGRNGLFFELSKELPLREAQSIFPECKVTVLPAVLPVVTTKDKRPQLFQTVEEWRRYAVDHGISFVQAAIEYEKASSGWSDREIWDYFEKIADIFDHQIHSLEERDYIAEDTPLLPVYGKQWNEFRKKYTPISDGLTQHILTHAYATNAKLPGVLIVPGPMGTGGGYLYSALDAVREDRGFSHEKEIEGLIVAAALGALAYTHTNASGERGCIGESGVCNAMASGAIAWMASPEEPVGDPGLAVERAASMALQANMGLVCDPIPGGLEFPCITRTFRAAVTAPMYAEMAILGIDPLIPYHECLQAMERHYKETPADKLCGANCGTCTTPTAERCKSFLTDLMAENLSYEA